MSGWSAELLCIDDLADFLLAAIEIQDRCKQITHVGPLVPAYIGLWQGLICRRSHGCICTTS